MEKRNVWENVPKPLELHEDARGKIVDVFYKHPIEHVAVIKSNAGVIRGNHYHKETVQHILMVKGKMEYWTKWVDSTDNPICEIVCEGDLITSPINKIHAFKIIEDTEWVVLTEGLRGGQDYEADTMRVPSIVPEGNSYLERNEKKVKLHLGCGKNYLPGYVHIDVDVYPHIDYNHDIKDLSMFENNSVDEIYSCGTFEYFDPILEVPEVLKEWRRVLKPNGILRTSVPNFESIIRVYLENERNIDGEGVLGPLFGRIEVNTPEGKKVMFHKTVYDFEKLKKVLEEAGFKNIREYDWKTHIPIEEEKYFDYSKSYMPRGDIENGLQMQINVVCEKQ